MTRRECLDSPSILDPLRFSKLRGGATVTHLASNSQLPNVRARIVVDCPIRNGSFEEKSHDFRYKLCYFRRFKVIYRAWITCFVPIYWFEFLSKTI